MTAPRPASGVATGLTFKHVNSGLRAWNGIAKLMEPEQTEPHVACWT